MGTKKQTALLKEWLDMTWKWWLGVCLVVSAAAFILATYPHSKAYGHLVYVKNPYQYNLSGVYVMDPDGNNVRRLTSTCISEPTSPVWSPDGQWIAFGCRMADGAYNLCVMGLEGMLGWGKECIKYRGLLNTEKIPARFCTGPIRSVSWSPDGQRLAITCSDQDGETLVYIITTNGRIEHYWPLSVIGNARSHIQDDEARVDWSPTRDRLAISFNAPDDLSQRGKIYLADVDGQNSVFLTEGRDARWSPDGKRLAFFNGGLYVIDQDGGNLQCIYCPAPHEHSNMEDIHAVVKCLGCSATWSPDGRCLAFGGGYSIYVVDLRTKEVKMITEPYDGMFYDPDWSP